MMEGPISQQSSWITGPFNANDSEVLRQLSIAGHGIAAFFDFMVHEAIASGELVTVLKEHPSVSRPILALYPQNRHLLPKVRVFIAFLAALFDGQRARRKR